MKYLITTIAAVVLVGCGESQQSATAPEAKTVKPAAEATDHSGTYILSNADKDKITLELKTDGSFTGTPKGQEGDRAIGSWKVEGEFLICEGTTENSSQLILFKFNKTTKKLISVSANGKEKPIEDEIPEGEDGLYLKKLSQAEAESQLTELSQAESQLTVHEAAEEGNLKAVKQHLADGADVNAKDDLDGMTPLHFAVVFSNKEIVELLIAEGADVNAKDDLGLTSLYHAVIEEVQKEIVELLIAKGADVNAMENDGGTPLTDAGDPEIADLLRKHGGKTGEELKAEGK
jgi:hypothetical protein